MLKTNVLKIIKETAQSHKDKDFVDFLFDKMTDLDTDMIDLQDDDSCDDHLQLEKLT